MHQAWRVLDNLLAGSMIRLAMANHGIRQQLSRMEGRLADAEDPRLELEAEWIEVDMRTDIQRMERIEDKARNNAFAIAVAVTVLTAGIGLIRPSETLPAAGSIFRWATAGMLLMAMWFLLLSGIFSLRAYKVSALESPGLRDRVDHSGDADWRRLLLRQLDRNRLTVTLKTNYFSASMDCLRNGIIVVGVFFGLHLIRLAAQPTC